MNELERFSLLAGGEFQNADDVRFAYLSMTGFAPAKTSPKSTGSCTDGNKERTALSRYLFGIPYCLDRSSTKA